LPRGRHHLRSRSGIGRLAFLSGALP
jgi:hypothetical protein